MPHRRLYAHLVARPLLTGSLLALLFVLQWGALGAVDVIPGPSQHFQREVDAAIVTLGLRPLIFALVPAALLTWLATRWLYLRLARIGIRGPDPRRLTLAWVVVWVLGWISAYELAAPQDVEEWRFALVAMGLALWAGAREGLPAGATSVPA